MPAYYPDDPPEYYAPPPQPVYYAQAPTYYGPRRAPGGLPAGHASVDVRAFVPAQYEHIRINPMTGMLLVGVGVLAVLFVLDKERKRAEKMAFVPVYPGVGATNYNAVVVSKPDLFSFVVQDTGGGASRSDAVHQHGRRNGPDGRNGRRSQDVLQRGVSQPVGFPPACV